MKAKCPDCGAKINDDHFDPEFQWYECEKCEGCFTAKELKPVAKKKKRKTEIVEEEVVVKKKRELTKEERGLYARGQQIPTKEIINVLADSIEGIYTIFGSKIDRVNADDKARLIVRELLYGSQPAKVSEHSYSPSYCTDHA